MRPTVAGTPLQRRKTAAAKFFVRVGQIGRTARQQRCEHTLPLFPLVLILSADGTLRADAVDLAERVRP